MLERLQESNLDKKRDSVFPPAETYNSRKDFFERRKMLLDGITALENLMLEQGKSGHVSELLLKDVLSLVPVLEQQMNDLHISDEGLKRHMIHEDGRDHFTEKACGDPGIMLDWITHELLSAIRKVMDPKGNINAVNFMAKIGMLNFYRHALDSEDELNNLS